MQYFVLTLITIKYLTTPQRFLGNKSNYLIFSKKKILYFFLWKHIVNHCKAAKRLKTSLNTIDQSMASSILRKPLCNLTNILLKVIFHESRDAIFFSDYMILSVVWIECLPDKLVFEINSSSSTQLMLVGIYSKLRGMKLQCICILLDHLNVFIWVGINDPQYTFVRKW